MPEGKGYEFGFAVFEELPKIKSFEINEAILGDKEIKNDPDLWDTLQCIDNPIAPTTRCHHQDPEKQAETQQARQGVLQHWWTWTTHKEGNR